MILQLLRDNLTLWSMDSEGLVTHAIAYSFYHGGACLAGGDQAL